MNIKIKFHWVECGTCGKQLFSSNGRYKYKFSTTGYICDECKAKIKVRRA